jgi:GNAT superfamily N-acetyltransferase
LIRRATVADAADLLQMMHRLAEFEGYTDRFAVTEGDLIKRGLVAGSDAQFTAWVKEDAGVLQGYALAYVIPFTFDLRPTVVLKELFVDDAVRSRGCGQELFGAVVRYAQMIDARLLRWQVLPSNEAAKRFYCSRGGRLDEKWESWTLELESAL